MATRNTTTMPDFNFKYFHNNITVYFHQQILTTLIEVNKWYTCVIENRDIILAPHLRTLWPIVTDVWMSVQGYSSSF